MNTPKPTMSAKAIADAYGPLVKRGQGRLDILDTDKQAEPSGDCRALWVVLVLVVLALAWALLK